MRAIVNTIATSHTISAQPSFQDYLRISQTARNAAQRARREAVPAFWCAASRAMRRMTSVVQH
jgi:hypothetical protein